MCDRPTCPGVCRDTPNRCRCVCTVRYVWSYEACAKARFTEQENQRLYAVEAEEDKVIERRYISTAHQELFTTTLMERHACWENKIFEKKKLMKAEIKRVPHWVHWFGTLVMGLRQPVTNGGKAIIARGLKLKSKELLVMRDGLHNFAELMALQSPPKLYSKFSTEELGPGTY